MKKSLLITSLFIVLFIGSGVVNGANCSKYAEQLDEIRSALEEARMNADGYAQYTVVQAESRGLSMSVAANMNTQNPYTAQVEKLEQLLILAEQDYQNCLNYSQNEFEQAVIDMFMELFEKGERFYNLGLRYLDEMEPKNAETNFMESYANYKALWMIYNEREDARRVIDKRYDIKPLISNSFLLIGTNVCLIGDRKGAMLVLGDAVELNNRDAKELYNICSNMTDEDSDNLWCSASHGDNRIGYRKDGKLYCKCDEGYIKVDGVCKILSQEEADKKCEEKYGVDSIGKEKDGTRYCGCKAGYKKNTETRICEKDSSYNTKTDDSVIVDNNGFSKSYDNEYSDEYNRAYEYAYANGITTMPTIEQANMHGYVTRAEISKMFSEWAIKHGSTIDISKSCKFNDISSIKGDLHDYIIKSCQLGIMGQGIKNFRPYDTISRAEVFTVISRMLRGNKYDGCDPYYSCHENAIARAGIYSDMRESERIQEFRGNVMMYLMRASGINI